MYNIVNISIRIEVFWHTGWLSKHTDWLSKHTDWQSKDGVKREPRIWMSIPDRIDDYVRDYFKEYKIINFEKEQLLLPDKNCSLDSQYFDIDIKVQYDVKDKNKQLLLTGFFNLTSNDIKYQIIEYTCSDGISKLIGLMVWEPTSENINGNY